MHTMIPAVGPNRHPVRARAAVSTAGSWCAGLEYLYVLPNRWAPGFKRVLRLPERQDRFRLPNARVWL